MRTKTYFKKIEAKREKLQAELEALIAFIEENAPEACEAGRQHLLSEDTPEHTAYWEARHLAGGARTNLQGIRYFMDKAGVLK